MVLLSKTGVSIPAIIGSALNGSGEEEVLISPKTIWRVAYRKLIGDTLIIFAEEVSDSSVLLKNCTPDSCTSVKTILDRCTSNL